MDLFILPFISAAHCFRTLSWKISRTCDSCDAERGSGFLEGMGRRTGVVLELEFEPLGLSAAIAAIYLGGGCCFWLGFSNWGFGVGLFVSQKWKRTDMSVVKGSMMSEYRGLLRGY